MQPDGSEPGGGQSDRGDDSAGTDLDIGNEEGGGQGSPISKSVRDPLRSSSGGFQAGDLGHGAGLEYTGDAYRITNPGGPLYSPFQDAELAGLVDAHVSVEYQPVSGAGMAGVACAITDDKAYVFIAGARGDGEPYYGIAYLDINERAARALRDSNLSETPDAADVVPGSETCGGKAATLAQLLRAGFRVPDGFVVPFATDHVVSALRASGSPAPASGSTT
jgi:hypothetical protein